MGPEFDKFEVKKQEEAPEVDNAMSFRADIANLLNLGTLKVNEQNIDVSDLSDKELIEDYFSQTEQQFIKAKMERDILDIISHEGNNLQTLESYLESIKGVDKQFSPDLNGVLYNFFVEIEGNEAKKIIAFNQLNQLVGDKYDFKPEVIDTLFQSGPFKSAIDNQITTKKMQKFLDEIDETELQKFLEYHFPLDYEKDEKKSQHFGIISKLTNFKKSIDFNKEQGYTIKYNEKNRPYDIPKEVMDFITGDLWEYWKDNRKLPVKHELDLTTKGKIIEFMITELFDVGNAFGASNIFPTAKVDDERVEGAHTDVVVQLEGQNIGIDVYCNKDRADMEKKYRNFIDYNPRQIVAWPALKKPKEQDLSKMIVVPLSLKDDVVIDTFKKYTETVKKLQDTGYSEDMGEIRKQFYVRGFPSIEKEISFLLSTFRDFISMTERTNPKENFKEAKTKLESLTSKFGGYPDEKGFADMGAADIGFKYAQNVYYKHQRHNA